jgi:oligosaccharide repeat unit polymerase
MNNLHHSPEISTKKTPAIKLAATLTLLWMVAFTLNSLMNVDGMGGFYNAHVFIAIYLGFVIFLLRRSANIHPGNYLLLVYGVTYIVFHFGIVAVYLAAPENLEDIGFGLISWYKNFELVMAAYLSAVIFLAGLVTSLALPIRIEARSPSDGNTRLKLGRLALIALLLGIVFWIAIVASTGSSKYDIFLLALADDGLSGIIGVVHTLIGMAFIVAVNEHSTRSKAMLLYGLWSLPAFSIGMRGEVAFPVVMALGLLAGQGVVRVTVMRMLVGSVVFLAMSSAVAQTRISTSEASAIDSISITKGLAELGGSLRPSYEVMLWLEEGDAFRLGDTYYAPFERFFLFIIPLWERLPALEDDRLMNILIGERAGPYGFSISAEAFYNFGYVGVAVAGVLTGFVLRHLGQMSRSRGLPILMSALGFALFIHIRQDFVTAWAGMFFATVVMTSLNFIGRRKTYV